MSAIHKHYVIKQQVQYRYHKYYVRIMKQTTFKAIIRLLYDILYCKEYEKPL